MQLQHTALPTVHKFLYLFPQITASNHGYTKFSKFLSSKDSQDTRTNHRMTMTSYA
jgi:hypothetical protein